MHSNVSVSTAAMLCDKAYKIDLGLIFHSVVGAHTASGTHSRVKIAAAAAAAAAVTTTTITTTQSLSVSVCVCV